MTGESTFLRAHQIQEGLSGHSDFRIAVKNFNGELGRAILQGISATLKTSQKFLLTENLGYPEDGEAFALIPEATNLPADNCYFERTQHSRTWGALAFRVDEKTKQAEAAWAGAHEELDPKWFCCLFVKNENGWALLPFVTGVYLNSEQKVKLITSSLFDFTKKEDHLEAEEIFKGLVSAATSEILYFLQIISCSNVTMQVVEKPHALNKKRAKKNLPAIDSYHVLKLPMSGKPKYEGQEHSDRNSPRLHFRRGHVRRLSPDQITWVSHCMVGDANKGSVGKEYQL